MIRLLAIASACLYLQPLLIGSVASQHTSLAFSRSNTSHKSLAIMGGFSFGYGSDRGAHFDTFSSSNSRSTSRGDTHHYHRSRRDSSPSSEGLHTMFDRVMGGAMRDLNSASYLLRERFPERGRPLDSSLDSRDFSTSAYTGFPGMPRGRRRSSSSSDSDRDTIRPSTYSRFPGMPGTTSSSYQRQSSPSPERSRSFSMRRTDSHSSSSDSRHHRSPSPPASTYCSSGGYRTYERAPESTWAPEASSSYHPGYPFRWASSQTRHQRSPSPDSRSYGGNRRRSPSPPPASSYSQSSRADSTRGYRAEERRPEGASSKTAGSSFYDRGRSQAGREEQSRTRAGAERPSANQYNGYSQYNGGYSGSGGQSYGTSQNAYNARPTGGSRSHSTSNNQYTGNEKKHDRARSPPPKSRSHTRDQSSNSRSRSGSSSSNSASASSKPKRPRAELKKTFDTYNAKWDALNRTDKNYPLPATSRELSKLDFAGGSSSNYGRWSNEQILTANVQLIFLAGFGMSGSLKSGSDAGVRINAPHLNGENMKLLGKWLSRKEQPRWHPDRINRRTGKQGVVDEGISKKTDVVAMRTAAQDLLAMINK
jgi:hypothetical protein